MKKWFMYINHPANSIRFLRSSFEKESSVMKTFQGEKSDLCPRIWKVFVSAP